MTTPKITTITRGGTRFYVHPVTGDRVPGVTSILNMLPKPFLMHWAAKVVAETAVDSLGAVVDLAVRGDRQGAIDFLKRAPTRDTARAAEGGTDVHELTETLFRGDSIGRVHPSLEPFMRGVRAFLDKYQPEFKYIEQTVWSEEYGYAGSFDWLAYFTDDEGARDLIIGDTKTTRSGVHNEVALQLTAYAKADKVVLPDGTYEPMPVVDGGAVLWLRPDEAKVVPVRISDDFFEVFRSLANVMQWDRDLSLSALGPAVDLLTKEAV